MVHFCIKHFCVYLQMAFSQNEHFSVAKEYKENEYY